MKRTNEIKKRNKARLELMLDPFANKSNFNIKLQESEKAFVKYSDD